jgi:prepilin-type N-terminal cleavage/methylation domain-containing protein
MHQRRGFTLIELLVAIAIIGVLSAVVLASLTATRSKGADAAAKKSLTSARPQGELFYYANGNSYANACVNASVGGVKSVYSQALSAANAEGFLFQRGAAGDTSHVTCNDAAGGWAVEVPLKNTPPSSPMYCVDYTGLATTTGGSTLSSSADVNCG